MRTARQAIQQTTPREAAMSAISAAVVTLHADAERARPEWFHHLLRRAERKAAKIAEQAAQGQYTLGDVTFIQTFAKSLPTLFAEALERLDSPEP